MGALPGRFRVLNPPLDDVVPTPTALPRTGGELRGIDQAGEGVPVPAGAELTTGGVALVPTPGLKLAKYRDNGSSSPEENPVGEGQEKLPDNGEGKVRTKMDGEAPTPAGELPALLIFYKKYLSA